MTTPIHLATNVITLGITAEIFHMNVSSVDVLLLMASNIIDVDHLFSRPIYHPKRNPFTTHVLHSHWKFLSLLSFIFLFVRPLTFLGLGLLLHFLFDYMYVKRVGV